MLKKRIIFTLLYDNGLFMLSRNFRLQKVGDLKWLKQNYNFSNTSFSIDELIILDITRGERDEDKFLNHVKSLAEECFVPIAAGGAIRRLEQVRNLLHSGADKVVVNTLLAEAPNVIREIADEFGQQSIVGSVDVKLINSEFTVWIDNGSKKQNKDAKKYLYDICQLPVGEIYLNSMDNDGTGQGYKIEMLGLLDNSCNVPVILAGGAGKYNHFSKVLSDRRVDAVATAHLFNFIGDGLYKARKKLLSKGVCLPLWDVEKTKTLANCLCR